MSEGVKAWIHRNLPIRSPSEMALWGWGGSRSEMKGCKRDGRREEKMREGNVWKERKIIFEERDGEREGKVWDRKEGIKKGCESPPWLLPWGWQWSFLCWWIRLSQDLFLSLWAALGPPSAEFHRTLPTLHCPPLLGWCSRTSTGGGNSVCLPSPANHAARLWTQPMCVRVYARAC